MRRTKDQMAAQERFGMYRSPYAPVKNLKRGDRHMGSFTRNDPARDADGESRQSDNWNGYGPAANRVFDAHVGKTAHAERDDQSVALLARAIQHEIIPRLMLAHRTPAECITPPPFAQSKVTTEDIEYFAQMILSQNEALALSCIESVRMRGVSVESLYLDLLAPAARYLGKLWEDDLCDFTEVTIGLGRLQQMLHELKADLDKTSVQTANGMSILLLPTPGEQHTFGLSMVAEFFRREGWEVVGGPYESPDDPAAMVRKQRFDVVGFSLATELHVGQLADCIKSVRKSSLNKALCIIVGGPVFAIYPEYAAKVHADLVVSDGSLAPRAAQRFVEGQASSA
jgi:methanogenic corrinoid protein MtbC1